MRKLKLTVNFVLTDLGCEEVINNPSTGSNIQSLKGLVNALGKTYAEIKSVTLDEIEDEKEKENK